MADNLDIIAPDLTAEETASLHNEPEDVNDAGSQDGGQDEGKIADKPADDGADSDQGKGRPPSGYVPQQALHEARQREKEYKERAERMEQTFQKLLERMPGGGQQQQDPKNPDEPEIKIPSYEDDPIGHFKAKTELLEREIAAIKGQGKDQQQRTEREAQDRQMLEKYASSVRTYAREKAPDYQDAYDHLAKEIDRELIARGYDDPTERSNIIQYEEGLIVGRAMKNGKDPAEIIYNLAKHRGYKPQQRDPETGKFVAAEDEKLERIEKGQKAAKSLGGARGSNDGGGLTLESLANLEGKEFDDAWEKLKKAGKLG